jgi:hypothetical protein
LSAKRDTRIETWARKQALERPVAEEEEWERRRGGSGDTSLLSLLIFGLSCIWDQDVSWKCSSQITLCRHEYFSFFLTPMQCFRIFGWPVGELKKAQERSTD